MGCPVVKWTTPLVVRENTPYRAAGCPRQRCGALHNDVAGRIKSDFNTVVHSVNNLALDVSRAKLAPRGARTARGGFRSCRYPQLWISCGYWAVVKWITRTRPTMGKNRSGNRKLRLPIPVPETIPATYPQRIHTVNNSHACDFLEIIGWSVPLRATVHGEGAKPGRDHRRVINIVDNKAGSCAQPAPSAGPDS